MPVGNSKLQESFIQAMNLPITLGLAGLATVTIAFVSLSQPIDPSPPSTVSPPTPIPSPETTSPRRLTITVSVTDPIDLKVKEGDDVEAGQLIADRTRERIRLESQKQQLELALQRLKTATITPPLLPAQVPPITALPSTQYLEQEAAIERAKVAISQAERAIALKQQEIAYLHSLDHLNPLILDHEQAQLDHLQSSHEAAVRDYQLAIGQLNTAQESRAYQEYEHSLDLARRVEAQNQAALEYQQQLAAYEQRLRDRDYQASQSQLKLDEVNNAIASLAVVKSPYAGRIRRIHWVGQGADGSLTAQITLLLSSDRNPSPLPEQ